MAIILLGWYSYKIVVKQLEQEYYNVYTAGAIKGTPYFSTTTSPPVPLSDQNSIVYNFVK
jgi:hypothetical protein